MQETPTPPWLARALATPSSDATLTVDGCPIAYTTWGEVGRPGVVLIHGSNAHRE